MPAPVAGIHACRQVGGQNVDGRDRPGRDETAFARLSFIVSQEICMTWIGRAMAIARNAALGACRSNRGTSPLKRNR